MGWENLFHCDNKDYCKERLSYHFPHSKPYGDIRTINGNDWRGKIDVLTGGFPCQPFSVAGDRRGTDDARFLWPEMFRLIREIEPSWVVAENVRGITSQEQGMVFERVCADLESHGYEVQTFCIPACAVGAPHRRDRIWFIANNRSKRKQGGGEKAIPWESRFSGSEDERGSAILRERSYLHAPQLCGSRHGISERLDACGNAICPQIASMIFRAIEEAEMSSLSA